LLLCNCLVLSLFVFCGKSNKVTKLQSDHSFDLLDELDNDLDVDVDAVVRADVYVVVGVEGDREKGVAVDVGEDVDLIVELDVD